MPKKEDAILTGGAFYKYLCQAFGEITPTAGAHNAIFRGANITKYLLDGTLYYRITGTNGYSLFEDLYIGDYVESVVGTYGKHRMRIAGFDLFYGIGDWEDIGLSPNEYRKHHAVFVPDKSFLWEKMNDTNTTAEGYLGSKMHLTTLPLVNEQLEEVFGEHLLEWAMYLPGGMDPNANSTFYPGAKGATQWCDIDYENRTKAFLMSVCQVTGATIQSSGWDHAGQYGQFPLFRLAPEFIMSYDRDDEDAEGEWWWLSTLASSTDFAGVGGYGGVGYGGANNTSGVRPAFLIG